MGKVHYERIPLRRYAKRYQGAGEVDPDPYDPLSASAGVSPPGTPRIDQIDWGQPSWAQQASEQSQRDQEAFAKEGVRGMLRDTEGTQDLAGGFSDAGFAGTIKAFHGSPHDFPKFDMSKIGTGEGAQAYGSGLYFAEAEPTAQSYKASTSDLKDWPIKGENPGWRVPSWVGKTIASSPRGIDDMLADFTNRVAQAKAEKHWNVGGLQDIVDALTAVKAGKAELQKPGHMYEVDINADPEHFLDWDKPLSEQHPKVKEALQSLGIEGDKTEGGTFAGQKVELAPRTGADIVQSLTRNAPRNFGTPGVGGYNPSYATQALREAGIPEIKYLDQHSRWATDMKLGDVAPLTRNFVVFDDALIDIIKKYGLAGLIAGGAAHFTAPADDAHGMARGGAAPADDEIKLTAADRRSWLNIVKNVAHTGKVYYEMPATTAMQRGSYRLGRDVLAALGHGDVKAGAAVAAGMFSIAPGDDPTIVHPDVVRDIGHGSAKAGEKVLQKFCADLRRQSREIILEHDASTMGNGHHGWHVR